ncbi:cyclic diguanosine monophosphate-binding protein [Thalassotalea insulae]|uniref:Cyclic diguanosine monophosphate-binding protein n=1 Tax=Thalassotalea insulae TaxID=2056778 RepID=A0ABQ6GYQ0_9GAMM|nr:PilZ domain-containing protein [Thalassotalea insulae]GLX79341.1 cyclic diguanosine monophosphate-binding protein [Thalassotalea insulae]
MENRRQFTRILFSIDAQLEIDEQCYPVNIHDISLNGALISSPDNIDNILHKLGLLRFNLSGTEAEVCMHIAVVHIESDEIGLQCNAIDIDSVTHLRRLVELNLGDESQLNKELSQLSRS